jgi:(p)ppGpp synthase/HD superfamily hydrolase
MPMSAKNPFNIPLERRDKAFSMKKPLDPGPFKLLLGRFSKTEQTALFEALDWLRAVKLNGRESNYLPHPVRVASYYLRFAEKPSAQGIVLGLVHNILEVSETKPAEIEARFGHWVREGCEALFVDRDRQKSDPGYFKDYYSQLQRQDPDVQRIKILDKLDNLLVLFLNPSEPVRSAYLQEIEIYLLPMVERQIPQLADTVRHLVADARELGHKALDDFLAQAR